MDRLNCHSCIRYLLPYPINNLSYILFVILYYLILYWAFQIFSPDDVFSFPLNICLKVWKPTNYYVCIFVLYFFNTLIYRYIAVVYVYRYVWKQNKTEKRKIRTQTYCICHSSIFFESLLIIVLSPSFFFKIYCLLVCLVDSCSFDLKHSCFFVTW